MRLIKLQCEFKGASILDLRGNDTIVDVTYRYVVKADYRKGFAVAEMARGFYDMNSGTFTSSEDIVFKPIAVSKISEWSKIDEEDMTQTQPFGLLGLMPLPDEPPLSSYQNPFTGKTLDPEKVKQNKYT